LEQVMKQGGNLTFAVRGTKWPGVANLYVSLFSLHKGAWENKPRVLDGSEVQFISAFFESSSDSGRPSVIPGNEERMSNGFHFRGDGFLLSNTEAASLLASNPKLNKVVFPVLNGDDLASHPLQHTSRHIINFFDWSLETAAEFGAAFEHVRKFVKPEREQMKEANLREKWWQFERPRMDLLRRLASISRCFAIARPTKYLAFCRFPTGIAFTNALQVFTTDRWNDYAVVQSTVHEVWARKYSGALETRLRYSPSDCFLTFALPRDPAHETALAAIGETYHEHRRALMRDLWLGLTDLYNLFHDPDLTPELITESRGDRATITGDEGFTRLQRLRELHRDLDQTVLTAYGWHTASDFGPPLALGHNFHPVEFLPENDRIRYTIHPDARRELLTRLLKLNHARAAEEGDKSIQKRTPGKKSKIKSKEPEMQQQLI
jgi:hypothetical protein